MSGSDCIPKYWYLLVLALSRLMPSKVASRPLYPIVTCEPAKVTSHAKIWSITKVTARSDMASMKNHAIRWTCCDNLRCMSQTQPFPMWTLDFTSMPARHTVGCTRSYTLDPKPHETSSCQASVWPHSHRQAAGRYCWKHCQLWHLRLPDTLECKT